MAGTAKGLFWDAVATVCLANLAVWALLAYVLKSQEGLSYSEGLPFYLLFFLLSLPAAYPIYRRYRGGTKEKSPEHYLVSGILFLVLSSLNGLESFRSSGWDRVFQMAIAMALFLVSAVHFLRWTTKRKNVSQPL